MRTQSIRSQPRLARRPVASCAEGDSTVVLQNVSHADGDRDLLRVVFCSMSAGVTIILGLYDPPRNARKRERATN